MSTSKEYPQDDCPLISTTQKEIESNKITNLEHKISILSDDKNNLSNTRDHLEIKLNEEKIQHKMRIEQ